MASPCALAGRPTIALLTAVVAVDVALTLDLESVSALASWWTSVGLGVALVALTPVRRWPLLVVTLAVLGTAVGLLAGDDLRPAATTAGLHALAAVAGALVVTRGGRRGARLITQRDLLAVVAASVTCGVIGLAEPFAAGGGGPGPSGEELLLLGAQHAVPTLLLCALALLGHEVRARAESAGELLVQVLLLCAVTAAVFAPSQDTPLTFLPIPVLVWAALRFDAGVVAAQLVGFAVAVTTATAAGAGPVAAADIDRATTGLVVLTYVLATALVALPLALTVRQRLRLLERVAADEHIFHRSFTESPLGMVLLRDLGGVLRIDELNDAACTILGSSREDVAGRRLDSVLDTFDRADQGLVRLLRGRADGWHGHAVALGRAGSRLEVAIAALDWRDGSRIYSAQLLDVTQEHDAQRQLVAATRLNDATLDTTACVILVTDALGTVVRVNAATRAITGFADDDLVGRPVWDLPIAALSRAETEAMYLWPNRSGYPMVTERLGLTADGEPLRIVWNTNVVADEHGAASYAVITGIDVTSERSTTGLMSHLLSASIATALVGVDGAGRITLVNAGAGEMLGWTPEDLEGRSFIELFDPEQLRTRTGADGIHAAFLCLVGMIGDRDESVPRDWTWRTRHGRELIVSMTLSVTEDLGEDRVGLLCVGRDVTAQREGQETLVAALEKERTAVERLRALDRAKDEFVSTVSHELRTPVTSILGYTEMLRDGSIVDPIPEQLPMFDTIARNGQRLVAICNDLLLLSGFESDASLGVRTRVDLRSCVASAYDSLSVPPARHGVTVHVEPGTTPLAVAGDRSQLDRLVANLLGNAVKFTPPGGRVDVTLAHVGGQAVLTVRDTGIGIPSADHDAVFQRFYRSEQAQTQAIPGTGLGLPIVAAIVRAHDGEITLDSEPGLGTTFRVLLPLTDQLQPV
ncbi:PAS domain S-box protein [Nocardioides sp.]|uniref:PAS domain S-box protein n=1 Tax=Nocardioides sp. TaxID=35761 RepID=UPI002723355C|nr:PAS domain S-box protein [Nocardioides sp.]MDO9458128.1 PAS domain S-box protein [Nocardioides sp.]